jgi:hypothetical protein
MMKAACTSETSVDNYFTRQYTPEYNSELHTRRRENLKSHIPYTLFGLVVVFFVIEDYMFCNEYYLCLISTAWDKS